MDACVFELSTCEYLRQVILSLYLEYGHARKTENPWHDDISSSEISSINRVYCCSKFKGINKLINL